MKRRFSKLGFFALLLVLLAALAVPSQSAFLTTYPYFRAVDANNNPLIGGWVWTYNAGTSTPVATYSDFACTIPNPNPVPLDSFGEAVIYGNAPMKLKWYNSAGSFINSLDNYGALVSYQISSTTGEIWVGDPVYGATIQACVTALGATPATLHVPAGVYTVAANFAIPANRGCILAMAVRPGLLYQA